MMIGKTRAGTEIQIVVTHTNVEFHDDMRKLSAEDQFDTYCMLQWFAVRALRKYGQESNESQWWEGKFYAMDKILNRDEFEKIKNELKLVTSSKQANFGKKMVYDFLREH